MEGAVVDCKRMKGADSHDNAAVENSTYSADALA